MKVDPAEYPDPAAFAALSAMYEDQDQRNAFLHGMTLYEAAPKFWSKMLDRWAKLPGFGEEQLVARRQESEQKSATWRDWIKEADAKVADAKRRSS